MWGLWAQALAQEVACYLGLDLSSIKIKRFADGEIYVQVQVTLASPSDFFAFLHGYYRQIQFALEQPEVAGRGSYGLNIGGNPPLLTFWPMPLSSHENQSCT